MGDETIRGFLDGDDDGMTDDDVREIIDEAEALGVVADPVPFEVVMMLGRFD